MRGRRHKLQVSTFPFLAVLLCAMGSLILILLVMDRKAHKAAQARAQREAARLVEENAQNESARQAERERLQQQARKEWEKKRDDLHEKLTHEQIEMQLQMRKIREELQGIAARLHYEQDTTTQLRRKTQDERSRLQAEEQLLRTLRSSAKQTESQSKESSQSLRRMTLDLLQMEQVLKDLKTARQREHKTFSVVPYHGRRGENRRPIYVECTADGVIFHPEHKAMPIAAFIPGSGDSASDVRAEVERRIAQQRQKLAGLPSNADKTPYLLLLLRPSGVTTYHLFQRALRGLPLDFGYEFIDDDWVLDFPANDELPSTQPWMIATKTPARPAPPPSNTASPPHPASARPLSGAPMGNPVGAFANSIRGFRAGEAGGSGSLVKGGTNPPGSPTSGVGSGSGGSGPAQPGNGTGNGPGGSGPAVAGSGTGGGPGGSGPAQPGGGGIAGFYGGAGGAGSTTPGGSGITGFYGSQNGSGNEGNRFGSSGGSGSALAYSSANTGTASNSGGMGTGPIRGSGRGHPSAMPPTFPSDEGGTGFSGDGSASGSGYRGVGGVFRLYGSKSGSGSAPGLPREGSPAGPGGDLPGLGPPRALSSRPGEAHAGGGTGQNGFTGTGSTGNGVPGNGWPGGGTAGPGIPGAAPGVGASGDGRYVIARGNNGGDAHGQALNGGGGVAGSSGIAMPGALGNGGTSTGSTINYGSNRGVQGPGGSSFGTQINGGGSAGGQAGAGVPMPGTPGSGGLPTGTSNNNDLNSSTQGSTGASPGSGQALNGGGGAAGTNGTTMPGDPGNGGSSSGAQLSASQGPLGNQGGPSTQGTGISSQGAANPSAGGTGTVIGGSPGGQASAGAPAPANGGRSSDVVIFVDPLTGKPTTAPRPPPSPDDGAAENPPPEEMDGNRRPPRVRVVPVDNAVSRGGYASGGDESAGMNRFAPTPSLAPPRRRPTASRPTWIHGGRDWTIYVECRAGNLVLYPSQRTFPLAQATSDPTGNPLLKAIQQMIDRRQSLRRRGEPPYHPQVCLLVRPEHIRTFLMVYPALDALPVPKMRRNLDADDDVISIVTGAVP